MERQRNLSFKGHRFTIHFIDYWTSSQRKVTKNFVKVVIKYAINVGQSEKGGFSIWWIWKFGNGCASHHCHPSRKDMAVNFLSWIYMTTSILVWQRQPQNYTLTNHGSTKRHALIANLETYVRIDNGQHRLPWQSSRSLIYFPVLWEEEKKTSVQSTSSKRTRN